MKTLLFICIPFIFRIEEGDEEPVVGLSAGREASEKPRGEGSFGEKPFFRVHNERPQGKRLRNPAGFESRW